MNVNDYIRQITFAIGDVSINVIENNGALDFTVTSLGEDDLRGLFFDFDRAEILSTLELAGVNINNSAFEDEGVINLKQGANLQGTGLLFDIGIAFGTAGSGKDVIQHTEFTLSSTTNALTLDDIANVEFGARTTSEGDKLTTIAPAAPDAKPDAYNIFEDGQFDLDSPSHTPLATKFEVLANDTDADADILTIIDVRGAQHGIVTIVDGDDVDSLPGDAVHYTPNQDYSGPDSFEYLISDGNGGTDFATATVSIEAVADIPSLSYEVIAGNNDDEVVVKVTTEQTDADSSEFIDRIALSGIPLTGVVVDQDGYNPIEESDLIEKEFRFVLPLGEDTGFSLGVTSYSMETSNDDEELAFQTLGMITDTHSIFEDGQTGLGTPSHVPLGTTFAAPANNTDANGNARTINILRDVSHGSIQIVDGADADAIAGDAIIYTPDPDYSGEDSYTYTISDANGNIDFVMTSVSVVAVADIPTLSVSTSSTANVNEVIFTVTAAQQDADISEFIDRIEAVIPNTGATISPLTPTSVGSTYTQNFLLTLPEGQNADFDLVFNAFSKENSNGDEQLVSKTISVGAIGSSITENTFWEIDDQPSPFSYDFNKFRGATTNGLKEVKEKAAGITVGGEADIDIGIQEDFHFDSGDLTVRVDRDTTVDTFYNSLTDILEIDTSSILNSDAWVLWDPFTNVELSAVFDFYADAFAKVNPGDPIGNIGTIRLSDISDKLTTMNNLNIDEPFVTFNNDTVPEGVLDLTVANPALLNDKGELPAFLDFVSIFYEKPEAISGWTGTPHTVETSKLVTYDIDLDELLWNMFELAVFPSLASKDGIKLALTQLAFDLNLNPFNIEAKIPGTGLFLDVELEDFDIVVDYDLIRTSDFDLNDLNGKIIFEDGTTSNFVVGDTLSFSNALSHDVNQNGKIDYTLELGQSGTLDHEVELNQDHSFVVEALDIRGGYDGVLGKWVESTKPLELIDETFNSVHYNLFDGTLPFEFTDQFSLSAPLVA